MIGYYESTEAYERKLIDDLASEKFSWDTIWKALQLTALTAGI